MDHSPPTEPAGSSICFACDYPLGGLPSGAPCPECGSPAGVADAFLIKNSEPVYQQKLLTGVSFVLNGIIAMILMAIVGIIISAISISNQQTATVAVGPLEVGLQFVSTAISVAIAYGWWLFSEADPKLVGGYDGGTPRQLVRVCVSINVIASVVSFAIYLAAWLTSSALLAGVLLVGVGLIAGVSGIVAFFVQMLYVKWLAPRLPNASVFRRSKTLLWLGPVLFTVGLLLFGLGPLIALVLYWNMLDKVRKNLKVIVAAGGNGFPTAA